MQNDIFWFDIPMDNMVRMKLINRITNLSHYMCYFLLRHSRMLFKLLEKLPSRGCFHDQIDEQFILEKSIHFYQICMI